MFHQVSEEIEEQIRLTKSQSDRESGLNKNKPSNSEDQSNSRVKSFSCIVLFLIFLMNLSWVIVQSTYMEGSEEQINQIEQVSHLISSDKTIPNYSPQDYYWFSVSTRDLILNSNLDNLYKRARQPYNMTRNIHLRAILFTQLIHNVDFHGNILVQLSPFQNDSSHKSNLIKNLIELQLSYFEQKYSISQYQNNQLRFCIVVPSYNNVKYKLYLRNLDSLFMQDYQNYHIVYIDDHSPDQTGEFVKKYLQEKQIPQDKIKVIINDVNKKAMQNIYEKIHEECPDGEIVGLIDGDDSFNGRQVLKLYNAIFHQKRAALIYSNFLKIIQNSRTEYGFGNDAEAQYFEGEYFSGRVPILATHFLTFYSQIFKKIQKENFCYDNGTFFDYAYDKAILTPLMEMAYERSFYLPEMVYEYRNDTGMNDAGDKWQKVADIIDQKPKFKGLEDWKFVDENKIILQAVKGRQN